MKSKIFILGLLPFLLMTAGCQNSKCEQNLSSNNQSDNQSDSQIENQIPYDKFFSSKWYLGNGEPSFNASQYEIYIRLDTEDIYYFDKQFL